MPPLGHRRRPNGVRLAQLLRAWGAVRRPQNILNRPAIGGDRGIGDRTGWQAEERRHMTANHHVLDLEESLGVRLVNGRALCSGNEPVRVDTQCPGPRHEGAVARVPS